ncbi:hypothetical protein [Rhizobium sp. AG855]|uniref:hypothetical protein n=1 Tax=Rhizobium sp. AG855 TaxID=2183898 RepID=UPI000FF302E3|nr:hypothetical protein [Rhizobium sp. AG855]RKE85748.1 hypothetical protein DFO46_2551 [Rhizobium sp. AG855]
MKKQRQRGGQQKRRATPALAGTTPLANGATVDAVRPAGADAAGRSGQSAAGARFHAGIQTRGFKLALALFLAGVLPVALALSIPHDFAFFELGFLFTLSIYDLVLAMLGLSVVVGMAERGREIGWIAGTFLGVLLPMLLLFDTIFPIILQSPLGDELFLIAPVAVLLAGVALWLPQRFRVVGAALAAAVVALSLSLFIGLDDFGIGIKEFAFTAVLGALWILLSPGLLLRPFRGAWLTIPARIIGSWLVVIAIIVTVSLYVPLTPEPQMPLGDPSAPDVMMPGIGSLDSPSLAPLDPAIEEGLEDAPGGDGSDLFLPREEDPAP